MALSWYDVSCWPPLAIWESEGAELALPWPTVFWCSSEVLSGVFGYVNPCEGGSKIQPSEALRSTD